MSIVLNQWWILRSDFTSAISEEVHEHMWDISLLSGTQERLQVVDVTVNSTVAESKSIRMYRMYH